MRRLWHQLTLKLFDFFNEPAAAPYSVDVFDTFVRDFESRLNQLRLVEMGVKVSKEIDSASLPTPPPPAPLVPPAHAPTVQTRRSTRRS